MYILSHNDIEVKSFFQENPVISTGFSPFLQGIRLVMADIISAPINHVSLMDKARNPQFWLFKNLPTG